MADSVNMKPDSPKPPVTVAAILARLVLFATAGLILVFTWKAGMFASLFARKPKPVVDVPLPEQITSGISTITGFDKNQQPYKLTAQSVLQDETNPDLAHLKTVSGMLLKNSGKELRMVARTGEYHKAKKILDLIGDVKLISQGEYTGYLQKARVTLKDKRLYATVPVTVVFDRGTIRANGVEITENGNRVLFFNGVKTRFNGAGTSVTDGKTDKKGN